MNRRAILLAAVALFANGSLVAQQQRTLVKPAQEGVVYEFKHLDKDAATAVTRVASEVFTLTGRYDGAIGLAYFQSQFGNPPSDWKQKTLEFLQRYDVAPPPSPQVHYFAYLIRAAKGKSGSEKEVSPIPKELADAIEEMKRSLTYTKYELLTEVASVSEGGASASDRLPDDQFVRRYALEYGHVTVSPDHKLISIHPFQFRLETAGGTGFYTDASISSDITVREGQKLVLGKVRLSGDADLFVILTAKVE